MKKIQLVRSDNAEYFVKQINDFCSNHNVIDIKLQTLELIAAYDKNGIPKRATISDTALIIYEE